MNFRLHSYSHQQGIRRDGQRAASAARKSRESICIFRAETCADGFCSAYAAGRRGCHCAWLPGDARIFISVLVDHFLGMRKLEDEEALPLSTGTNRFKQKGSGKMAATTLTTDQRRWFQGSFCIDDEGRPRRLYHSTSADAAFDHVSPADTRSERGRPPFAVPRTWSATSSSCMRRS
jgi:hypothetical protein